MQRTLLSFIGTQSILLPIIVVLLEIELIRCLVIFIQYNSSANVLFGKFAFSE